MPATRLVIDFVLEMDGLAGAGGRECSIEWSSVMNVLVQLNGMVCSANLAASKMIDTIGRRDTHRDIRMCLESGSLP